MRKTIEEVVSAIDPLDPLEKKHQTETLSWIQSDAPLFRIQKPAVPPKHLVSYSSVFDPKDNKLLLTHHKLSGLWIPPGGHVDENELPIEAAKRELKEELNIELPLLKPNPLFITVTETVGSIEKHTDVSLWFVFIGDSKKPLKFDEREFHSVKWYPLNNLPKQPIDPYLKRFREKLTWSLK